ncbi:MAG: homoserine O-succinyltransferase MetX [Sphingomonadales bacterium]
MTGTFKTNQTNVSNIRIPIPDISSFFLLPRNFRLESGDKPSSRKLYYRLTGPSKATTIAVFGGISADNNVCDSKEGRKGWWRDFAGVGKALDIEKFQILSFDFVLPSLNTEEFVEIPAITTLDQANCLLFLLDELQITKLHCLVGASYGGMIGLSFANTYPDRLKKLAIISAAEKPDPMSTAWRSIQRKFVCLPQTDKEREEALSLARQLAMTTYRTRDEFKKRFTGPAYYGDKGPRFEVEDYLGSRGSTWSKTISVERFLALSLSIDLHRINPKNINHPTLIISSIEDQLVPIDDIKRLKNLIGDNATLCPIHSIYGHDAFLKEVSQISNLLNPFIGE